MTGLNNAVAPVGHVWANVAECLMHCHLDIPGLCDRRETDCFYRVRRVLKQGVLPDAAVVLQQLPITGWWFGTYLFSHILGIILPIDFHIFQRGWNHQPDRFCQPNLQRCPATVAVFVSAHMWQALQVFQWVPTILPSTPSLSRTCHVADYSPMISKYKGAWLRSLTLCCLILLCMCKDLRYD